MLMDMSTTNRIVKTVMRFLQIQREGPLRRAFSLRVELLGRDFDRA